MAPEGSRRVEVAGQEDKMQITATFASTLSGEFLIRAKLTAVIPSSFFQVVSTSLLTKSLCE